MLYLDTGCLVKLYYPEPESALVASAVSGERIGLTDLHVLELTTALQAKVFRREATPEQADAARAAIEEDLAGGKLVRVTCDWAAAWKDAQTLALRFSATTGCRALDTLHCAVARLLAARELLTTDARQLALAAAAGIAVHRW